MSITKYVRGLCALAVVGMALTASAFAQPGGRMVCTPGGGTVQPGRVPGQGGPGQCGGLTTQIQWPGFPPFTINTFGTSSFDILAQGFAPPSFTTRPALFAASFTASGNDPIAGAVTWGHDFPSTMATTNSFAVLNTLGFWDSDIYIQVRGTFGFMPGRTFRGMNELHFRSVAPGLTNFNPHVCGHYQLVNPVPFEDVNMPGVVQFTVTMIDLWLDN